MTHDTLEPPDQFFANTPIRRTPWIAGPVFLLVGRRQRVMALTPIILRLPPEWIEEIESQRGDATRAAWIRDCIRTRLGRRDHPEPPGRGRPVSEPPPPAT